MKAAVLRTLLALIELVALVQIAACFLGPMLWRAKQRELPAAVARGGEPAVTAFRQATETAADTVAGWGAGLASTVLVAALIGSILCRKPRDPRRQDRSR